MPSSDKIIPITGYGFIPKLSAAATSRLNFTDSRCIGVIEAPNYGCVLQTYIDAVAVCNDHPDCSGFVCWDRAVINPVPSNLKWIQNCYPFTQLDVESSFQQLVYVKIGKGIFFGDKTITPFPSPFITESEMTSLSLEPGPATDSEIPTFETPMSPTPTEPATEFAKSTVEITRTRTTRTGALLLSTQIQPSSPKPLETSSILQQNETDTTSAPIPYINPVILSTAITIPFFLAMTFLLLVFDQKRKSRSRQISNHSKAPPGLTEEAPASRILASQIPESVSDSTSGASRAAQALKSGSLFSRPTLLVEAGKSQGTMFDGIEEAHPLMWNTAKTLQWLHHHRISIDIIQRFHGEFSDFEFTSITR
ncbi:hypothetical protein HDU97_004536 [Phlyctochytrium planicorne]|nr:hypothetical protein HDU97_004536 [Phlyctochytrium planicorne]